MANSTPGHRVEGDNERSFGSSQEKNKDKKEHEVKEKNIVKRLGIIKVKNGQK